jgi:hypothetical protein
MSVVHAAGIHVRHALTRALATSNRSPMESTWRMLSARVQVDARGRVVQGEVSLRIERARELHGGDDEIGLVNPDGLHPLMARVPGHPGRLMDIFPVTTERWARVMGAAAPVGIDPWCPRTGITAEDAQAYARAVGKRLPDAEDVRAAWGRALHPWGDRADPTFGRPAPPRYGEIPEVGMHPPTAAGFFDLGCWLFQWTADGVALGGMPGLIGGAADAEPRGFRCVADAEARPA